METFRAFTATHAAALGAIALLAVLSIALVLPLDIAFGWNYVFVGPSKPQVRTIVDLLAPWPERLGLIALIAAAAMALVLLPWELARRRTRKSA